MGIEYLETLEKEWNRKEVSYDTNNSVVMSNDFILRSASNLTLNEMKLLRLIITQCKKDDKELYTFSLRAKDFAKLLDVDADDMRRNLRIMTRHIMQEVLEIENPKTGDWLQFHWTDECRYKTGIVTIKIADRLRPYLLDLKGHFTRYKLEEILPFKSAHAFKIYEILIANIDDRKQPHADQYSIINVSMDTLRTATMTKDKYTKYANFRVRVLEPAVREINDKTKYHVTAKPYKNNKTIIGIEFLVESQAGYYHRTEGNPREIKINTDQEQLPGQMDLFDYKTGDNKFTIT